MKNRLFSRRILLIFTVFCIRDSFSSSSRKLKTSPDLTPPLTSSSHHGGKNAHQNNRLSNGRPFLRVTGSGMKDQSAISGDKVQFKCKIEGWPRNISYTWYKDELLIDPAYDHRVTISEKQWGSRLKIKELYTPDSGIYKCIADNGINRIEDHSELTVSFQRPPPLGENEKPVTINFPGGKCEKYAGHVCSDYFGGLNIFVDSFEKQKVMESQLTMALGKLADMRYVSKQCQRFAVPAFCYFVFTPCHVTNEGKLDKGGKLCREDCELLKHDVCMDVYSSKDENSYLKELFNMANCSLLPSSKTNECARIGMMSPIDDSDDCFHGYGEGYRGNTNVAKSGKSCKSWPIHMAEENPELFGGHNFCRNPRLGGTKVHRSQPWCFVDDARSKLEDCEVPSCTDVNSNNNNIEDESAGNERNILLILIPCACAVVIVVFLVIVYLRCCHRSRSNDITKVRKNSNVELDLKVKKPFLTNHLNVPELSVSSILFEQEIGQSEYGKIFQGKILNDRRFAHGLPVAIKTFDFDCTQTSLEVFNQEVRTFSELCHPNITCLLGIINHDNFHCLVFEYDHAFNLHQFSTLSKPSTEQKQAMSLDVSRVVRMLTQVADGMDYLTGHGFIHKDLAAHNILVQTNNDVKINIIGGRDDIYRNNYYQVKQSGILLPIRWMAPESIQSGQFTSNNSVWSFGVLVWEMLSYGLQPYYEYNDHEVLDMVTRHQLLNCPEQCPARFYSLMCECWRYIAIQRPSFKEILVRLHDLQYAPYSLSPPSEYHQSNPPQYTDFCSYSEKSYISHGHDNQHQAEMCQKLENDRKSLGISCDSGLCDESDSCKKRLLLPPTSVALSSTYPMIARVMNGNQNDGNNTT